MSHGEKVHRLKSRWKIPRLWAC